MNVGFELEFHRPVHHYNLNWGKVKEEMKQALSPLVFSHSKLGIEGGYKPKENYQVGTDGDFELRSRVYSDVEKFREIGPFLQILQGYKMRDRNSSVGLYNQGLHVHVELPKYTYFDILYHRGLKVAPSLYWFWPGRAYYHYQETEDSDYTPCHWGRGNPCWGVPKLEYRIGGSTFDLSKILFWLRLCQRLTAYLLKVDPKPTKDPKKLLRRLGMSINYMRFVEKP